MLPSQLRNQLEKSFVYSKEHELQKNVCSYVRTIAGQCLNRLLISSGEEASVLRGELRAYRQILKVLSNQPQGGTHWMDSPPDTAENGTV